MIPIRNHSHYSLLASTSRCEQIVKKCKEYGYTHAGLTDISTVSGVVTFIKSCKEEKITPIIGSEIILKDGSHLTLICKNKSAWTELLRVISLSNNDSNFDEVPRISFEELVSTITPANFVVIDGYIGSFLFNEIFPNKDCIFNASDEEAVRGCAKNTIPAHIEKMSIFPDYYLEVDRNSPESLPVLSVLCEMITECDPTHKYTIPSTCSFYPDRRDAVDHRVLLCVKLKTTLKKLNDKIESLKDIEALKFIRSSSFYIKGPMDHIEQELQNLQSIASKCESFDIFSPPRLPKFKTPNGESEIEYLKELCRTGWKRLISTKVKKERHEEYKSRVLMELDVIEKANLAGYFLIVQDYVNEFRNKGVLVGHGRGCLQKTNVVMADGGIKDISEILPGESIISDDGLPHQVSHVHKYEVNEELLNIKTYFGDRSGISLTKDHKVLALKRKKNIYDTYVNQHNDLRWYKAEELSVGDCLFQPIIETPSSTISFDMTKYLFSKKNGSKAYISDGEVHCYSTGNQYIKNKILKSPIVIELDEDLAYAFGVFVGDGWFSKGKNYVNFCFNSETNNDSEHKIKRIMKSIGCDFTECKNQNGKKVNQTYFKNEVIYHLFKDIYSEYYGTPDTKYIPECIINSPRLIKLAFLDGLVSSDGHIDTGKTVITTVSKRLAYQIKYLLLSIGTPSSVSFSDRADSRKDFSNLRRNYSIVFNFDKNSLYRSHKNGFLIPIREVTSYHDSSYVYDLTIDGDPNYLTSSGIVHNSAAGCLVSYLLGITLIDPIPYGLLFSRFYSAGRNIAGSVSLPDIDVDFPPCYREEVISYIRNRYGNDKVCQMITYGRLAGKSIIKEVLRVNESCSPSEMNKITEKIPNEAAISDLLEEMDEPSVIMWALEHDRDSLIDYCWLENGELRGDYAKVFEQAIRMEGIFKNQGKHAAGVIVCADSLDTICPMVRDKHGHLLAGMEMGDLEALGCPKVDILGVSALEKLANTVRDVSLEEQND